MTEGETLTQICKDSRIPDKSTVNRWLNDPERADFASQYARARELMGDAEADESKEVYRKLAEKLIDPQTAREMLNIITWRAKVLNPKRYADMTRIAATDAEGNAAGFMFGIIAAPKQIEGK